MSHSNSPTITNPSYFEQIDIPTSTIARLAPMVRTCMACKLTPILMGPSGCGKTELVKQIAEKMKAKLLHLYTAHLGSEEIKGLFFRSKNNEKTYSVLCNEELFSYVDAAKAEGAPLIIFLDELNRASDVDCLNALFSMISKRGVPGLEFPENVYLIAAGNPPTGNFAVAEMADDAYIRRLVWFGVKVDAGVWLKYAEGKKSFSINNEFSLEKPKELPLHHSVTGYIAANPTRLSDPALADQGKPHPNPASWVSVSNVLKVLESTEENSTYNVRTIISGLIGGSITSGFYEYYNEGDILLSPEEILNTKWTATKKKLDILKENSRHDLASEMVTSLCLYITREMPVFLKRQITNFSEFVEWLEEDQQALISKKLTIEESDPNYKEWKDYKDSLMLKMQTNAKFAKVLDRIQELRLGM
jgi:hypothetical protein